MNGMLSQWWMNIQGFLFSEIEEDLGPLTKKQQQLIEVLEIARVEEHIPSYFKGDKGRPPKSRAKIARAFVAKAVYNMTTTRSLIDRLRSDIALRRICGWERQSEIPHESAFSRAFDEFSNTELPQRVHCALINKTLKDRVLGHLSRDSTAIKGREKPQKKIL